MRKLTIVVRALWDAEAAVWVATSDDLRGLVTEARTQRELSKKLRVMIPELLEGDPDWGKDVKEVPVVIVSEQLEKIRLRA
jgi:hypothetical protein